MDEFLRDIHTTIFREWILFQKHTDCKTYVHPTDEHIIVIKTNYSYSEIVFNHLNIIELSVKNTFTDEIEFYLHFQMKTMKHAIELYHEMLESIQKLIHRPVTKILLSCSGGMTTSFFASKMNEASKLLFLNYEVSAIGYNELFNVGTDYDIIMLAPQISYLHAKVQEILKDQVVIKIPPQVFAKYDVGQTIGLIKQSILEKRKNNEQPTQPIPLQIPVHAETKILVLSIFRNSLRVHVAYRLYDEHNHVLLDNDIIKPQVNVQDIFDVIDTCILHYPDVKVIGLSTPGIINEGCVVSANVNGLGNVDLSSVLKARYTNTRFVFDNDVNTAAVGYYASQKDISSLAFLFQPTNYLAGAGIIIEGHLIKGRYHVAGEVQYLPMNLSKDWVTLAKTPEGALEVVSKTIASIVSIVSPEAIILFCIMIPQIQDLKKELERLLPTEYIPQLIKVDDIQEYILIGQMILCTQSL